MRIRPYRERTLRQRLTFAAAVVALATVVGSLAVAGSLIRLEHALHAKSDVLTPAQVTAAELLTSVVDQETALRGYLLDRDRTYLQPYYAGRDGESRARVRLQGLLRGHPDLLARLAVVERDIDTWNRTFAQPVLATGARGSDLGKAAFDAIRGSEADLDRAVGRAAAASRDRVTSSFQILIGTLLAALVALAVILALLARALRVWVTGPLRGLGADAMAVASGSTGHPVNRVGPPDVAALAAAVESMRRQLVRQLDAAQDTGRELAAQADDLRRSNRDLEQFAYVASHDLQEPLRKVASFCQLLERRYGDQLDDRAGQYIDFAVDGAKRMQQLINDLLAFSRVGRTSAAFVDVRLDDALERATGTLATVLADAGAEVTADPLPTVRGDPTLLTQLFQNLVGNAVKFRGDQPPRVHIGVREVTGGDDAEWELCCSDNGIGVSPEYADKIFVIFQRLHGRDVYEGTGIGLALCRKIVEFHEGRLWLDTTTPRGAGATFRWTLPRDGPRRTPALTAPTTVREPGGGT